MDFPVFVRRRLKELGTEQRDLAAAAEVTDSYISQLLTGKKAPPAPERTDIYDKMEAFLQLPAGRLATLAQLIRADAMKRRIADPPTPLFHEVRELILRKCVAAKVPSIRTIFENEPFGALERLVTQKLLDVVKRVTREELKDNAWLRLVARHSGRSYAQMRVMVIEFLEVDVFTVSAKNSLAFLDPLIESWDIDLVSFGMEIVLNRRLAPGHPKKFEFVEQGPGRVEQERGFKEFLHDPTLRGDATVEEIAVLERMTFTGKRPTALYYYRELQNLRDPLHFQPTPTEAVVAPPAQPRALSSRTKV